MKSLRICFIGDSLTVGTYDDEFLGWPGRLCQAERKRGVELTAYNLGIRSDTSIMIGERWQRECQARLPDIFDCRLVFSFGENDAAMLPSGEVRMPLEASVAAARDLLLKAKAWRPTLWIGPLPTPDRRQPFRLDPGVAFYFDNARTAKYNTAYRQLAREIGVPYLDLFTSLSTDQDWDRMQHEEGDGVHPPARGYARIAKLVEAWPAWRRWYEDQDLNKSSQPRLGLL